MSHAVTHFWSFVSAVYEAIKSPTLLLRTGFLVVLVTSVLVYVNNRLFMNSIFGESQFDMYEKFTLLKSLTVSFYIENGLIPGILTGLLVLLFSLEVALIIEYIRDIKRLLSGGVVQMNILSLLGGILGFGCVACGSLLSILPVIASFSTALVLLPFGGLEFSVLGVLLLIMSIGLLEKRIVELRLRMAKSN